MKRLLWINLGLALLVGALAWLLLAKPNHDDSQTFALSTLQAAQVNQITLSNPNLPQLVLRKQNDTWEMIEPIKVRADASRVASLLGLLAAHSTKRLAATDLARFELDKPLARVQFGTQEFVFGANNPLSNQIYVMTQGQVYLVSPVYLADLLKPVSAFVDKALLTPEENPVGFAFEHWQLQRDNGTWRSSITHPKFSQDAANIFADAWRHTLATQVQQTATLNNPHTLYITLQSGKKLQVRYAQEGKDWLLQRDDLPLSYRLSESEGKVLLSPAFAPGA